MARSHAPPGERSPRARSAAGCSEPRLATTSQPRSTKLAEDDGEEGTPRGPRGPRGHDGVEQGRDSRQRHGGDDQGRGDPRAPPRDRGDEQVQAQDQQGQRPVLPEAVEPVAARPQQPCRGGGEQHGVPAAAHEGRVGGGSRAVAEEDVEAPADRDVEGGDDEDGRPDHHVGRRPCDPVGDPGGEHGEDCEGQEGRGGQAGAVSLGGRQRTDADPRPDPARCACSGHRRGCRHPASVVAHEGPGLSGRTLTRPRTDPGIPPVSFPSAQRPGRRPPS